MKKLIFFKTVILFLVIASAFIFNETGIAASSGNPLIIKNGSDNELMGVDKWEIFRLVNSQRRKKGLAELQWSNDLEKLARSYSKKMADGKFFSHYERNGDSVVQRATAMRIRGWRKIGENLFMCSSYGEANNLAVEKWMKSPLHRQNILDGNYNTTGIGIAESRDGTFYITQVFTQN